MIDREDGTYDYSFSASKEGVITISILLLKNEIITADYYNPNNYVGTRNHSSIDEFWGIFDPLWVTISLILTSFHFHNFFHS